MAGLKKMNSYAEELGSDLYEACPKAVFAAMAASFASSGGSFMEMARKRVITEWAVLHEQGIVPQQVPSQFRHDIDKEIL